MFFKIRVNKNCAIFKGKHLCWSVFLIRELNSAKKRLQKTCFPLNIAKFLRTAFLIEHLFWLLLWKNHVNLMTLNKFFWWLSYAFGVYYTNQCVLLKNCPYSELFCPHFPVFRLNTETYRASLCIQSEYGKMRTRITPNTVTFHAVVIILELLQKSNWSKVSKAKKENESLWWYQGIRILPDNIRKESNLDRHILQFHGYQFQVTDEVSIQKARIYDEWSNKSPQMVTPSSRSSRAKYSCIHKTYAMMKNHNQEKFEIPIFQPMRYIIKFHL